MLPSNKNPTQKRHNTQKKQDISPLIKQSQPNILNHIITRILRFNSTPTQTYNKGYITSEVLIQELQKLNKKTPNHQSSDFLTSGLDFFLTTFFLLQTFFLATNFFFFIEYTSEHKKARMSGRINSKNGGG
jgi:hypothetical protein